MNARPRQRKSQTLSIGVEIDPRDIARTNPMRDLLQFVYDLDEARGDWDFTLALAAHFDALRAEYEKEQAEDEAKLRGVSP
jgi:hypothetical protein